MVAPATDERLHFAAISEAIKASLGTDHVYDLGRIPGLDDNLGHQPDTFVVLQIERRYQERTRLGFTRSGWRVVTRHVGRTVNEARWVEEKVTRALDDTTLTVGGESSTPVTYEANDPIRRDDDRYSGVAMWTYVL